MFLVGVEFAESLVVSDGHEHGIIAKTPVTPGRPGQCPVNATFEAFDLTIVRPGERQRASKMGVMPYVRPGGFDLAPNAFHRAAKIAIAVLVLSPPGRKNARQPVQRVNRQPAVVGEGRQA